jgi:hypothetical protein
MIILHGIYSFKRRVVAYRNDFCLSCAAPRVAYQSRTFDVLHIFFVPLIPLGLLKRWHCEVCDRDLHIHPGTRKSFKWAGVVLLGFLAMAGWIVPDQDKESWFLRILFTVGFVAALWHTVRSKPDLRLKEKLRDIQPANESVCPRCGAPLLLGSGWHCSGCGIERQVVKA